MTVIIVLSDCPPKLRGDMTKWFIEINTGVYVGNMSARVRDEVWERVTENIGKGHATMVFTTQGEQHMDFRVHNAYWEPVDFEGIKLMRRPDRIDCFGHLGTLQQGFSTAAKRNMVSKIRSAKSDLSLYCVPTYVILDIETTGLNENSDEIIEIAALLVERDVVTERFHRMVRCGSTIPPLITELTGITDEELNAEGVQLAEAIEDLAEFAEELPFVCHNAKFDHAFLDAACRRIREERFENHFIDTLAMSQALLPDLESHKLLSVAEVLNVQAEQAHRALADCQSTFGIYVKLKELVKQTGV